MAIWILSIIFYGDDGAVLRSESKQLMSGDYKLAVKEAELFHGFKKESEGEKIKYSVRELEEKEKCKNPDCNWEGL